MLSKRHASARAVNNKPTACQYCTQSDLFGIQGHFVIHSWKPRVICICNRIQPVIHCRRLIPVDVDSWNYTVLGFSFYLLGHAKNIRLICLIMHLYLRLLTYSSPPNVLKTYFIKSVIIFILQVKII